MGLTERICDKARDLGFDLVGVAPAAADAYLAPHLDSYRDWIDSGYHGKMGYMARADRVERRTDPGRIVPGVGSAICVGLNYYPGTLAGDLGLDPAHGLISNYAWGLDYHDVMLPRLEELAAFTAAEAGREISYRAYVDTGPVLERAYAARAGLGFIGKNTCLIHPKMGSWLFLGEVLVDIELVPTSEQVRGGCGTCQRCLDACPTGALVGPYVLDARRCISYLTIELKGSIPHQLRPLMGSWIYGCDVCQDVCPWQRFAQPARQPAFLAEAKDRGAPALLDLIGMGDEAFRREYGKGPILRTGRGRLLRNVAVALGNWGDERAATPLVRALGDGEPLVRGHAAWALARVGGRVARAGLGEAFQNEQDPYVRQEMEVAMKLV